MNEFFFFLSVFYKEHTLLVYIKKKVTKVISFSIWYKHKLREYMCIQTKETKCNLVSH